MCDQIAEAAPFVEGAPSGLCTSCQGSMAVTRCGLRRSSSDSEQFNHSWTGHGSECERTAGPRGWGRTHKCAGKQRPCKSCIIWRRGRCLLPALAWGLELIKDCALPMILTAVEEQAWVSPAEARPDRRDQSSTPCSAPGGYGWSRS